MTVQNILQKKILFKEHASEYLTVFCLLTWIFLLPFSSRIDFGIANSTLAFIYLLSLLSVITWLLLIKACRHLEISNVEPLKNLSPLVVFIFAYLIFGETVKLINGMGILLLIVGGYLLEAAIHHGNIFRPLTLFKGKYVHFIFFSLLLGGVTTILSRYILLKQDVFTTLFFLFFFASINTLLIQFSRYKGMQDIIYVFKTNGLLVVIVVIVTIISDLTYFTALAIPTTFTALVISIRRISTLFVTIIGGEIFHETQLLVKSFACIIMLLGVYLIIL